MRRMGHGVYLRQRTDKLVDVACIGLDQVFERMPFEERHQEPRPVEVPPSVVVRRRVFVKKRGAQTAVRKVLVLRTDKAGSYPAYVVHFTDFSAARKVPLETGIRTAATEAGAQRFVEEWLVENVKKGWTEVDRPEGVTPFTPPPTEAGKAKG